MRETRAQFLGREDPLQKGFKYPGLPTPVFLGLPGGSDGKKSACNERDLGLTSGLGRSSGRGYGNPLQYSWLETPTDRGAWKGPRGHRE